MSWREMQEEETRRSWRWRSPHWNLKRNWRRRVRPAIEKKKIVSGTSGNAWQPEALLPQWASAAPVPKRQIAVSKWKANERQDNEDKKPATGSRENRTARGNCICMPWGYVVERSCRCGKAHRAWSPLAARYRTVGSYPELPKPAGKRHKRDTFCSVFAVYIIVQKS